MRVLVTGATGLLGSHLVDLLVERGESVLALARPNDSVNGLEDAGVDICRGDLANRTSLERAVRGVELVLHCAARTGPWGPRREYELTNVRGLAVLMDLALAAGVRRFVHVSSITVVGNDVRGVADETAPLRIEPNPYSWSKVAGELLIEQEMRRRPIPVTIVRPGWIYGPRDTASLARFASMIQQGKMAMIGSGDNHLPLIYVRDVCEGILLASMAAQAAGRVYTLVNDEPVTQRNYLYALASELGAPPPVRSIPYRPALLLAAAAESAGHLLRWRQPPPITRYGIQMLGGENNFVIRRARQELRFSPQTNLSEGVRRGIAWYREAACANTTPEG